MDRGATAAYLAQLESLSTTTFLLGKIVFDAETLYMTNFTHNVIWNGDTYIAGAGLLDVSEIEENAETRVTKAQVTFQIVDQAMIADFLTYDYVGRAITLWKGYFVSGAVVVDPIVIFQGTLDDPVVVDDPTTGKSQLEVTIIDNKGRNRTRRGRRTNNEEQQRHFSGDLGFDHVPTIPLVLKWGRA